MRRGRFLFLLAFCSLIGTAAEAFEFLPESIDFGKVYRVELDEESPLGEASIREHSIVWNPQSGKYYLVADVIGLDDPHHPNTYDTEIHLWSSPNLEVWNYHGVAVEKGTPGETYDGHGVASPAGMAYFRGRLYVPFSARKTSSYEGRSIGLAVSGAVPEDLPWRKTAAPISDLEGEDDDPAFLTIPGDDRLHLYHRRTGPGGYRIVHTCSGDPERVGSWPEAEPVIPRPQGVRAQELTGVFCDGGRIHFLVIEHFNAGGTRIAHLVSRFPGGPFEPASSDRRYLPSEVQPSRLAYGGHISPVPRNGSPVAFFWTVPQKGNRYGLEGHPVRGAK